MGEALEAPALGFGTGKWEPRRRARGAQEAFGVCASTQYHGMPADRLCVSQRDKDEVFASFALRMLPGERNPVPLDVREVRFAFRGGDWTNEDDGTVSDFAVTRVDDGAILVCSDVAEFEAALQASLDERAEQSHVRISVYGVEKWGRQNLHLSFFDLNGFRQAWRALRAHRDRGFILLDG